MPGTEAGMADGGGGSDRSGLGGGDAGDNGLRAGNFNCVGRTEAGAVNHDGAAREPEEPRLIAF